MNIGDSPSAQESIMVGQMSIRYVAAVVNVGGPPDRAKLLGVMSRYGLVPAPVK